MNKKLKIENLGIETTLEKFLEDWDLDVNEINEKLEKESSYSDDYVTIKREDGETTLWINTFSWEVTEIVSDLYDDNYFYVVKEVYYGENDDVCEDCDGAGYVTNDEKCKSCEGIGGDWAELNYTEFAIRNNPTSYENSIVFKGGEHDKKSVLNEDELSRYYDQLNEGKLEFEVKYFEFWFVKKKDFIENGWKKTIKSLIMDDLENYPL